MIRSDISILIGTFASDRRLGLFDSCDGGCSGTDSEVRGADCMGYWCIWSLGCSCPRIWNDLQQKKTKATAVFGLTAGMAAMAVVMVGANLLITPMFMGVSKDVVWKLMPFIIGFNVIKAGINGGRLHFFLYKRIAMFLRKWSSRWKSYLYLCFEKMRIGLFFCGRKRCSKNREEKEMWQLPFLCSTIPVVTFL